MTTTNMSANSAVATTTAAMTSTTATVTNVPLLTTPSYAQQYNQFFNSLLSTRSVSSPLLRTTPPTAQPGLVQEPPPVHPAPSAQPDLTTQPTTQQRPLSRVSSHSTVYSEVLSDRSVTDGSESEDPPLDSTLTQSGPFAEQIKSVSAAFDQYFVDLWAEHPRDVTQRAQKEIASIFKRLVKIAKSAATEVLRLETALSTATDLELVLAEIRQSSTAHLQAIESLKSASNSASVLSSLEPPSEPHIPSWADVASNKRRRPRFVPDFPVVIKPKVHKDSVNTRTDFETIIDPVLEPLHLGVKSVRPSNEGQLIVGALTADDRTKIIDRLDNDRNFKANYSFTVPRRKQPRIRLKFLSTAMSDTDTLKAIWAQNAQISAQFPAFDLFSAGISPVFHQKAGPNLQHIVFQASSEVRSALLKLPDIKVGLRVVSAENYILVTRCYKCCGYGHRANTCTHDQKCSHCAESHSFKFCPYFQTNPVSVCVNCAFEKRRLGGNIPTNHSAFSSECPALKRYIKAEFARTDWVQNSSASQPS